MSVATNGRADFDYCVKVLARLGVAGLRLVSDDTLHSAWCSFGNPISRCQWMIDREWVRRFRDEIEQTRLTI